MNLNGKQKQTLTAFKNINLKFSLKSIESVRERVHMKNISSSCDGT